MECRLCLGDDGPLVAPAPYLCRGPRGLVHFDCLLHETRLRGWSPGCPTCKHMYRGLARLWLSEAKFQARLESGASRSLIADALKEVATAEFDVGNFAEAQFAVAVLARSKK